MHAGDDILIWLVDTMEELAGVVFINTQGQGIPVLPTNGVNLYI